MPDRFCYCFPRVPGVVKMFVDLGDHVKEGTETSTVG